MTDIVERLRARPFRYASETEDEALERRQSEREEAAAYEYRTGIFISDIGEPGIGIERVIRGAQHRGTAIVTDRPELFDEHLDLLASRGVNLERIELGKRTKAVIDEMRRKITAYHTRISRAGGR